MKTYQGGIVIGHKKRFAVVRVEKAVIDNREDAIKTMQSLLPMFPGLPVVLVAEEAKDRTLFCPARYHEFPHGFSSPQRGVEGIYPCRIVFLFLVHLIFPPGPG